MAKKDTRKVQYREAVASKGGKEGCKGPPASAVVVAAPAAQGEGGSPGMEGRGVKTTLTAERALLIGPLGSTLASWVYHPMTPIANKSPRVCSVVLGAGVKGKGGMELTR